MSNEVIFELHDLQVPGLKYKLWHSLTTGALNYYSPFTVMDHDGSELIILNTFYNNDALVFEFEYLDNVGEHSGMAMTLRDIENQSQYWNETNFNDEVVFAELIHTDFIRAITNKVSSYFLFNHLEPSEN